MARVDTTMRGGVSSVTGSLGDGMRESVEDGWGPAFDALDIDLQTELSRPASSESVH